MPIESGRSSVLGRGAQRLPRLHGVPMPAPPATHTLPLAAPLAWPCAVRVKRSSLHLPPWTWITAAPTSPTKGNGQQQQAAAAGGAADAQPAASASAAQPAAGQQGAAVAAKGAVETMLGEDGQPDLELMERVSAYPASKSWGRADTAPKVGWAERRSTKEERRQQGRGG